MQQNVLQLMSGSKGLLVDGMPLEDSTGNLRS